VSTSMRIAWGDLVTPDEQTAAYSLVYLIQELAILIGPLILAVLIGAFSASAALITVAAIAVAGSLAFAASVQIPGDLGSRAPGSGQAVLRVPNMQVLVVVAVLIGGAICAIQVAATAFATAHRAPAAAGVLIAAVSVGGIIGAAIYATGRWRTAPSARLALLLTALTLSLALVTAAPSPVLLTGLLLLAGLPLNPALSTLSLLVDQHVPRRSAGEAFGWLSTGIAGGTGAGSAIAATLAQHQHHADAAFIVAVLAAVAATGWRTRLARPGGQAAAGNRGRAFTSEEVSGPLGPGRRRGPPCRAIRDSGRVAANAPRRTKARLA
jgi:hypothetical protein